MEVGPFDLTEAQMRRLGWAGDREVVCDAVFDETGREWFAGQVRRSSGLTGVNLTLTTEQCEELDLLPDGRRAAPGWPDGRPTMRDGGAR
jgi:hypothetical protein